MCDSATQATLETIITAYVADRKMFTALNVSREAQRNHGVSLRHNEMKNETHRVYAAGSMTYDDGGVNKNYDRKLVDLPGIQGKAWAYFPDGVDPDNYDLSALLQGAIDTKDAAAIATTPTNGVVPDPFGLNAPVAPAAPTVPATVSGVITLPKNGGKAMTAAATGRYAVDKRKRLWVPRQYLKAIGLKTGDWVDVTASAKSLNIAPKGKATGTVITSYKLDSHSNIALSRVCFDEAKLDAANYDILNMNGAVVVKQA